MAYNNHQQVPFWDFVRAFDNNGAGVDHHAEGHPFFSPPPPPHPGPAGSAPPPPPPPGAFPWGVPGGFWGAGFGGPGGFGDHPHGGRGGWRGRHHGRHGRQDQDGEGSRSRSRTASPSDEKEEGEAREGPSGDERRQRRGHRGCRHRGNVPDGAREGQPGEGCHGPRRFGGRGGRGHRGGWGCRGPPSFGGPGGLGGMGGFDMSGLFEALNAHPLGQHPWAQVLRQYAEQAGVAQRSADTLVPEEDSENTFVPPIDVFSTETAHILHIALPGAKKEDVGVNFDSDKGVLNVAGVVYRQGDEELLKTLSQSERKVGIFDRSVKLPPADGEKEEVDGDAITAKLEDGVLIVTVPKVEKEWTDVKKVDIE